MMVIYKRSTARLLTLLLGLLGPLILASCGDRVPRFTPAIAEPATRPARNFTSFAKSLRCMDDLLLAKGRRGTLISSTYIPDETNLVNVGADDMLINAFNQLNRKSRSYIFVDQALVRKDGIPEIQLGSKKDVTPSLYIRGSISQLDANTASGDLGADFTQLDSLTPGFSYKTAGYGRDMSVVTVDMHLVAYPSRRVLTGGSVANSMVVVSRGWGTGAKGLIENARLGVTLEIDRIESRGQAVRNLVELNLIELIGRHAGVPYWTCLELPATDARNNRRDERRFTFATRRDMTREAQEMLQELGLYYGQTDGKLDDATRRAISTFQAKENILPNGIVDYDLITRLRERTGWLEPMKDTSPPATTRTASTKRRSAETAPLSALAAPTAVQRKPAPTVATAAPKPIVQTRVETRTLPPAASTPQPASSAQACPPQQTCTEGYVNLYEFLQRKQTVQEAIPPQQ
ncbi:peptidoglycan-binding protein [Alphaproteobacteria bacterium KMM 3653]|uniref:Peptidoglycan-binding protein n=1 Tax=Harenicola maris TaxID=2841044 RepID=A0AAP2CPK2_9RHOB|nr:peptidoglycan-binding protein [Harenicola maris]